jgi:hypothetical protein
MLAFIAGLDSAGSQKLQLSVNDRVGVFADMASTRGITSAQVDQLIIPVMELGFGTPYPGFNYERRFPGWPRPEHPERSAAQSKDERSAAQSKDEGPPLPAESIVDEALGAGACPWLDDYVAFSRAWSPRAFDGFHEACALWLLSTVAARRVVLHVGPPRYTNLYIALVAHSSQYTKSTAAAIAIDALRAAGLDWLLAPDDSTPQKFITDLTGEIPARFADLPPERQARVRARLALPAQRGWFYEEFGQHLEAMTREHGIQAEFRGLLKRFDDCKTRFEYATIARGSDILDQPYLALLACLTPADLRPLARRGALLWNDGYLARFAFAVPDDSVQGQAEFP